MNLVQSIINESKYPASDIKEVLSSLIKTPKTYLMFYDTIPEQYRPIEVSQLFDVLRKLKTKEFSVEFRKYFILTNDVEKLPIDALRMEAIHHDDNQDILEYLRKKDNPQTPEALVIALLSYYNNSTVNPEQRVIYETLLNNGIEVLQKINKVKAEKSPIIKKLFYWLTRVAEKEGFDEVERLAKLMKLDLLKIAENIEYGYCDPIRYPNNVLKKEHIESFDNFLKQWDIPRYKILKSLFNIKNITLFFTTEQDTAVVSYFWDILQEQMISLKEDSSMVARNLKDKTEPQEMLKIILSNKKMYEKIGLYNEFFIDREKIFAVLNNAIISEKLKDEPPSTSRRFKI